MTSGTRHLIREALGWTFGLLVVFLAVYFYDDIQRKVLDVRGDVMAEFSPEELGERPQDVASSGGIVRIRQDGYGHYSTDAVVNGHILPFMVDTGATLVVLTYEDAQRSGLFPNTLNFSGKVQTANGIAQVAPVRLSRVRVGGILLRDIPAVVAERGVLAQNLLGMSFLSKLKRFEIENGQLVLTR
ncbi:retropepsin-like aspartic protease family protein [Methyloligella solikamskensis]|uniref:TIGR02281 family clan AA aspartic protease n=1 Tax=Methyloligella solikamskensis TaxID=1177756 RepID=A0ABW3JAM4_9HYPH